MRVHLMNSKVIYLLTGALLFAIGNGSANAAVNEADAVKLLKVSKCLNCHDMSKTKKARSYKDIAAANKGDKDATARLTKHITVPSQTVVDGEDVDHGIAKTKDAAQVKNLVEWILSR